MSLSRDDDGGEFVVGIYSRGGWLRKVEESYDSDELGQAGRSAFLKETDCSGVIL